MKRKSYRVGIDVGDRSVGLAAVEIDIESNSTTLSTHEILDAKPKKILNAVSYVHDGSLYDLKKAVTRRENAGIVRRASKRLQTRKKRLRNLDKLLEDNGFPIQLAKDLAANMPKRENPLFQWEVRSYAADNFIENEQERKLALTIAVLHIARHRGWRNPYSSVGSLKQLSMLPSDFYKSLRRRVIEWLESKDVAIPQNFTGEDENRPTPAQLVLELFKQCPTIKIRGSKETGETADSLSMGKMHQSDYYAELERILTMQQVNQELSDEILELVFRQTNPRDVAAAAQLVGKDDLQPSHPRASRSSIAFQEYRILSTITNLRIAEKGGERPLTREEIELLFDMLKSPKAAKGKVDWNDIADVLNVRRSALKGVGGETEDGEPISSKRPPVMSIENVLMILGKSSKGFGKWLDTASDMQKEIFVLSLDNAGIPVFFEEHYPETLHEVAGIIESFDDETLAKMDVLDLETGRASYGIDTLQRLNRRMLEGLNLHEARKAEFGVADDWKPSPSPLGTLVGNGSADRVIRIVSRWLLACEKKWGPPLIVNIEHAREGFKSVKTARKVQREHNRRYEKNLESREELRSQIATQIADSLDSSDQESVSHKREVRQSDIRKQQALERQNNQCLYCGAPITFKDAEMDHVVPRKRWGTSNSIYNLVAVCKECNGSKGDRLYSAWALPEDRAATIDRVKGLTQSTYFSLDEFKRYQRELINRLQQTEEDDDLDVRSFESVAWMARELRRQIEGHLREVESAGERILPDHIVDDMAPDDSIVQAEMQRIFVYQGWVTSAARKAGGIEKALPWLGGAIRKDRLDRRHHAIDAAVIAMINPGAAQIITLRNELRRAAYDEQGARESNVPHSKRDLSNHPSLKRFEKWRNEQMASLRDLLVEKMKNDAIPVLRLKRLKIENGDAHGQTVYKATKRKVGAALSPVAINKASSVALWTALTGHPDYDPKEGLPEDPSRRIRLHDKWLEADDQISFLAPLQENGESKLYLDDGIAYQALRGGLVELGGAVHHVRIFRVAPKKEGGKPLYCQMRVFQADLLNANGDLFEYELPASSYSRRFALPKVRAALDEGKAEYLGWMVIGDEIRIDPSRFGKKGIADFFSIPDFENVSCFVLVGYESASKLKLRPACLSSEGLDEYLKRNPHLTDTQVKSLNTIMDRGWRISINDLMASNPKIIRRNTMGYVRWKSHNHMPVSWQPEADKRSQTDT